MAAHPPPTSYQAYFADAGQDPHQGDYRALMQTFRTADNPTIGSILRTQVGNADPTYPLAFLGLTDHQTDECGRLIVLHGVSKFPATLGRPTNWDGELFAFTGEVVENQTTTVHFPVGAFNYDRGDATMQNVPATSDRVLELFAQNPNDELLGPFGDNEANIRQSRTRQMVPLPHRYVPLLFNRDLTPKAGFQTLVPEILANNDEGPCQALLNWITMAVVRNAAGQPPSVLQGALAAPVADGYLIRHRREILLRHLPGLGNPATSTTDNAALVRSVGQVVAEQRLARTEARDRAASAQLPKGPRSYFGNDVADSLQALCQVNSDDALPSVWHRLAAGGKKDRLALEQAVLAKARELGMPEQAPIVTPDLTKKVTGLLWAGAHLDELHEGIQPFALTLPDYANSDRGQKAQQQAETYDLLTSTSSTTTLRDTQSLKATKAVLPNDFLDARAHLTTTMLIWTVLVGETHPFVIGLGTLVRQYSSREHFYRNRMVALQTQGPPPVLLLRFVQLRVCNYWREALAYQRLPTSVPDFTEVLSKLTFSDSSWIPQLPRRYLNNDKKGPSGTIHGGSSGSTVASDLTGTTAGASGTSSTSGGSNTNPAAPVRRVVENTAPNPEYAQFRDKAGSLRVVDAIAKAGHFPSFERDGQNTNLCIAYHLRHKCVADCPRARDHAPHTPDEAAKVVEWCQKAYAS